MSGEAFVLGLLALLTLLLSVVVWSVFATARAKASSGHHCDELAVEVETLSAEVDRMRRTRQDR